MLGRTKFVLSVAAFAVVLMVAPSASADSLQIVTQSGGFQLTGLGNNGTGSSNSDVLIGNHNSDSHNDPLTALRYEYWPTDSFFVRSFRGGPRPPVRR